MQDLVESTWRWRDAGTPMRRRRRIVSGEIMEFLDFNPHLAQAQEDPERGGFKSLTEQIDTTTSGGKLIFHIFGALAEFERDIIKERTNAGLEAARARGKRGGRPPALSPERIKLARRLYADTSTSVAEICKMLGISRHTLQRYVKE